MRWRTGNAGRTRRGVWNRLDALLVFGATGSLSDEELLGRFVARRDDEAEAAFAALVERYGPMVLGVCRRVLGNRDEAEDAFQATFLVLARKADSIARPERLANWLFGVARRAALDARACAGCLKARERRVQAISRSEIKPASEDQPDLDELRAILDEELARLPERYRGALVLCELDGLTRRAAAERLGIPEGTLASRLARAKDLLRHRLVRRGLAPSALVLHRALALEAPARAAVVPLSLVDSTIKAASRVAAGAALSSAASTSIATLAQGVLKAMLLAKLKGIVLGLATAAIVTAGVGVVAQVPSRVSVPGIHQGQQEPVAVAQPVSTKKSLVLPGSTALDPTRLARVRARFAPARVVSLVQVSDYSRKTGQTEFRELRPGDSVKKGDLLAVFYSAEVASKKKDLLDALVQLELDQKILDRVEKNWAAIPEAISLTYVRSVQGDRNQINRALNILKQWDIPQDEIDALHAEAKRITADKDAWLKTPEGRWIQLEKQGTGGKTNLDKETENRWGRVTLRAPIDGVVVERNVHNDEMVLDNTVNLFQIADVSRLLVVASCPEGALSALGALRGNVRQWTVRTVGAASETFTGTIDEIGYQIDPNQHTAVIKGYIENPGKHIRGGQYVSATVNIPPPDNVVEIPVDALVDEGKQSLVFVQADPASHEFKKRRVEVVERFDRAVFVKQTPIPKEEQLTAQEAAEGLLPKEALRPGERVLLRGAVVRVVQDHLIGSASVENRLSAVERKLDQILEALRSLRRPEATKLDLHESDAPK